jgi:hypothetical protein
LNPATFVVPIGNDFAAFDLSALGLIAATDMVCGTVCADADEKVAAQQIPVTTQAINILFIVRNPFLGQGQTVRVRAITKSPPWRGGTQCSNSCATKQRGLAKPRNNAKYTKEGTLLQGKVFRSHRQDHCHLPLGLAVCKCLS